MGQIAQLTLPTSAFGAGCDVALTHRHRVLGIRSLALPQRRIGDLKRVDDEPPENWGLVSRCCGNSQEKRFYARPAHRATPAKLLLSPMTSPQGARHSRRQLGQVGAPMWARLSTRRPPPRGSLVVYYERDSYPLREARHEVRDRTGTWTEECGVASPEYTVVSVGEVLWREGY